MTFDQKVDDWRSRRLPKIKKSRATLEAEIIRLTARVAELEAALMDIRQHYTSDQSAFAGFVARAALSTPTGAK